MPSAVQPRRVRLLGAVVAAVAVLGIAAAGPAWAVADPVAPAAAPPVVEAASPYLPQVSCDPVVKPGTAALRALLLATYGGRDLGITRGCSIGSTSEHKEGRAFDWGLNAANPAEAATATQFLTWLLAPGPDGTADYNARRLGVMYVIWNGRIWGSYTTVNGGWKAYTGAEAHTDHIHISLAWNGAMKRTSFWTGTAAPVDYGPCRDYAGVAADPYQAPRTSPCPAAVPLPVVVRADVLAPYAGTTLRTGDRGVAVIALQQALGVPADGVFGPVTAAAVTQFNSGHGLPAEAVVSPATWAALGAGKAVVPTAKLAGRSRHWMPRFH